jgi:phospholipase C
VMVVGIANAPAARALAAIPTEASSPGIETFEHVVVVVQENRSFDHYVAPPSRLRPGLQPSTS